MLKEINCEIFRTKKIEFNSKLNVVLGDSEATNSIGKSTLLMVLDFVFGGNTYLSHNKDVVTELGDHTFNFKLVFFKEEFFFSRSTDNSDVIYKCDSEYNPLVDMSVLEFSELLKVKYQLDEVELTWRSIVGLYARIWGKPNAFVKKPIQLFDKETDKVAIVKLIKVFDKFSILKELIEKINKEKDQRKNFNKAIRDNILPQVSKTEFKKNEILIQDLTDELEDIKNNILKYTVNVSEITNQELLRLKNEKEQLLKVQFRLENKRNRLQVNLDEKKPIKSKHLDQLTSFFPNSNVEKIEKIETFHSKLFQILKKEFESEKGIIEERLEVVLAEIANLNIQIDFVLGDSGNPINVVNRIYDLTNESRDLKRKNETFEKKEAFKANVATWDEELTIKAKIVTDEIQESINQKLIYYNNKVHSNSRVPPVFLFNTHSCSFEIPKNTGTGKAYVDLILFDIVIFELTNLPMLIHDSFLFKNIENSSVSNLARVYSEFTKQTFIAVDEIEKYDLSAQHIFQSNKCIELDDNNLLFTKDWRESN